MKKPCLVEDRKQVGRPTAYKKEYAEQAYKMCLCGAIDRGLAKAFGVQESTINNWKHKYPEFLQSIKEGKLVADAKVAHALYRRATGDISHPVFHVNVVNQEVVVTETMRHYPPDTKAAIFWLKNRQPENWRDKVEQKEEVNLHVFPPKEVLKEMYDKALKHAADVAAQLKGRRERLGLVMDEEKD